MKSREDNKIIFEEKEKNKKEKKEGNELSCFGFKTIFISNG